MCLPAIMAQQNTPWWMSKLWGNGEATQTSSSQTSNTGGETRSGSSGPDKEAA